MRRELFKFWYLVRLILEILRYWPIPPVCWQRFQMDRVEHIITNIDQYGVTDGQPVVVE